MEWQGGRKAIRIVFYFACKASKETKETEWTYTINPAAKRPNSKRNTV
jgi:hypothetical protein